MMQLISTKWTCIALFYGVLSIAAATETTTTSMFDSSGDGETDTTTSMFDNSGDEETDTTALLDEITATNSFAWSQSTNDATTKVLLTTSGILETTSVPVETMGTTTTTESLQLTTVMNPNTVTASTEMKTASTVAETKYFTMQEETTKTKVLATTDATFAAETSPKASTVTPQLTTLPHPAISNTASVQTETGTLTNTSTHHTTVRSKGTEGQVTTLVATAHQTNTETVQSTATLYTTTDLEFPSITVNTISESTEALFTTITESTSSEKKTTSSAADTTQSQSKAPPTTVTIPEATISYSISTQTEVETPGSTKLTTVESEYTDGQTTSSETETTETVTDPKTSPILTTKEESVATSHQTNAETTQSTTEPWTTTHAESTDITLSTMSDTTESIYSTNTQSMMTTDMQTTISAADITKGQTTILATTAKIPNTVASSEASNTSPKTTVQSSSVMRTTAEIDISSMASESTLATTADGTSTSSGVTESQSPSIPTSAENPVPTASTVDATTPHQISTTPTTLPTTSGQVITTLPSDCDGETCWCDENKQCQCKPGYKKNGNECKYLGLEFGGTLYDVEQTTKKLQRSSVNIAEVQSLLNNIYSEIVGCAEPAIVDTMNDEDTWDYILYCNQTVTEACIQETFTDFVENKCGKPSTSCAVGNLTINAEESIASAGTSVNVVCAKNNGYCNESSTECVSSQGYTTCSCKKGLHISSQSERVCVVCGENSHCNFPFGTCDLYAPSGFQTCQCMFGFYGKTCNNPWLFVLVITLPVLLVAAIAVAFAYAQKRKKTNSIKLWIDDGVMFRDLSVSSYPSHHSNEHYSTENEKIEMDEMNFEDKCSEF